MAEAMMIQGQQTDSKEEYYFGMALQQLKIPFAYQVPIAGGRGIRGGQIIDFLLQLPPQPIPVSIEGSYWHRNKADDRFKAEQLRELTHGSWSDLLQINAADLESVASAVAAIKKLLRLG